MHDRWNFAEIVNGEVCDSVGLQRTESPAHAATEKLLKVRWRAEALSPTPPARPPARPPACERTHARTRAPLKHSREGSARAFVHVRACARARVPGFIVISSIKARNNSDNDNKINNN